MIGELFGALFGVLNSITQVIRKLLCEFLAAAIGGVLGVILYHYLGAGKEVLVAQLAATAASLFYLWVARRVDRELQYGWFKRSVQSLGPALGTYLGIRLGMWLGFTVLVPVMCVICTDAIILVVYYVRDWLSSWLPRT